MFQDPDKQLFSASVEQEISFGILNLGVAKEQARTEVEQVMEELEIVPFRKRPVHALSGGQKKQVSIADILVMRPEIIILDEPAAALDPKHTRMVNEMVDKLTEQGNHSVLMATHDMDYAYAWADEIVLMKDGKVLCQGAPEAVCRETEKLKETNLEEPALLQLFDRLKARKIIEATGKAPRTWKELEQLIDRNFWRGRIENGEKGILVVSFGTSHLDTMAKTIQVMEEQVAEAFRVYGIRAFTSQMILNKLERTEHKKYDNVRQALERMKQDGITRVIVQPTHIINGI